MKPQSNTLRTTTISRTGGQSDGWDRILFCELRDNPTCTNAKRVEEILSLLVAANTYLDEWTKAVDSALSESLTVPGFLGKHRQGKAYERAYYSTLERLTVALKRYHWRSTISGGIEGFREDLDWEGQSSSDSHKAKAGDFHWEYALVRLLLNCMRKPGELSRFRRCSDCQNWFYAATSHQRFCGEQCRRHYTARSPEFKEKRRNYMKQIYRPQQKQRDLRSFELAKGSVRR
jgi:hypothetical protein